MKNSLFSGLLVGCSVWIGLFPDRGLSAQAAPQGHLSIVEDGPAEHGFGPGGIAGDEKRFTARDGATRGPVAGLRYRTANSFGRPNMGWRKLGSDGVISFAANHSHDVRYLELDAPGYRTLLVNIFFSHQGTTQLEMGKIQERLIQVFNPDSTPATNVSVAARIFESQGAVFSESLNSQSFTRGAFSPADKERLMTHGFLFVTTDQNGMARVLDDYPEFREFPGSARKESDKLSLIALSPQGYAEQSSSLSEASHPLQLLRWATVEGTLSQGEKRLAHETVVFLAGNKESPELDDVQWVTRTDAEGRFRFDHVPPGARLLIPTLRVLGAAWTAATSRELMVNPGATNHVHVSLTGVHVHGVLEFKEANLQGSSFRVSLIPEDSDSIPSHPSIWMSGSGTSIRSRSTPGSNLAPNQTVQAGGKFEFWDVPPGRYRIRCHEIKPMDHRAGMGFGPQSSYGCDLVVEGKDLKPGDHVDVGVVKPVKRAEAAFPGQPNIPRPPGIPLLDNP